LFWLCAGILLAAGTVMTGLNVRRANVVSERMNRKIGELKVLRSIEADLARYEAARKSVEQLPEKHPDPLLNAVQEILPGVKADDVRDTRRESVQGWVVRQKEISFGDVPVGKVMELVRKVEAQKLPWLLSKCVIRASPKAAGTGQVILLMEAVDRTE
jgi:hypothetical protein